MRSWRFSLLSLVQRLSFSPKNTAPQKRPCTPRPILASIITDTQFSLTRTDFVRCPRQSARTRSPSTYTYYGCRGNSLCSAINRPLFPISEPQWPRKTNSLLPPPFLRHCRPPDVLTACTAATPYNCVGQRPAALFGCPGSRVEVKTRLSVLVAAVPITVFRK